MLTAFEFVCVNERLVVAHPFGEIIGVRDLNFHVERTIGALIFNVNVKTNALAVNTSLDSFFAFGVGDLFDFDVKNQFKKLPTQVGINLHCFAKDEIITNGSVVPLISNLLVSHKLTSIKFYYKANEKAMQR